MSTITVPRFGGFSLRFLRLELRRMLRNRRTVIFTMLLPSVFFIAFGSSDELRHQSVGNGNVTAYVLVSMAVYGAMLATTSGGAMVSLERSLGWSRQLRLTPLSSVAYIAVKVLVGLALGLASIVTVFIVGSFFGATMPATTALSCGVLAFVCASVFAAFGLFMGYILPSDNVMQILGPGLALLGFLGGLFMPLEEMGDTFAAIAKFTPAYGVSAVARYPMTHEGHLWLEIINVLLWLSVFVAGAAWRFRRDTARA